jgi:hypothetical protein
MKTLSILLFLVVCIASTASAQAISVGPGLEYATPLGSFGDKVNGGFGAVVAAKLSLPFISVVGGVDYIWLSEKEVITNVGGNFVSTKTSAELMGLNAGATFGLFPLVYAGAEVGTYFVTEKVNQDGATSTGKVTLGSFAPIVGASFGMFDVSARYVFIKDSNFLLLRGVIFF